MIFLLLLSLQILLILWNCNSAYPSHPASYEKEANGWFDFLKV